ncbi:low-specificity L-threonine aldolase [Devosia sp. SD17-2]|jgi:threonine aldolase|uniref:low-specificity L-threonine aldolase n=1 Tax=Devosia sp. SD17-2 TaxID=2976459 RepID=UPI0023D8A225|nr:low-specificity L-threonine aldolase [Devosia sp. SD17-2]WEJ34492.1 low-specificity L-threonine aldolase [Devosia sp. SD17-2]
MNTIRHDFRSDTVTRPTPAMRAAMAAAEVGDDVFGDDPSVNRLEQRMEGLLGKEAAIFVPSGTQSNLLALMSYCGRGDEFIAGQNAHCYKYEAGGAAVLGSIQPQPIEHRADGTMDPRAVEAAIKSGDFHFATTKVIALENTFGGRVLPLAYMEEIAAIAQKHGLGLHLDGARAFNAAVALGIGIADFTAPFDSVSICLSKGLGAPVGSVLVGRADLIETARRNRKMLGGGMRQAGILAAAGLHALEHHVERLAEDHRRAKQLAEGLGKHKALNVTQPDTNILWVNAEAALEERLTAYLTQNGVGISGHYGEQRWVTHLDVTDEDVESAVRLVDRFFAA